MMGFMRIRSFGILAGLVLAASLLVRVTAGPMPSAAPITAGLAAGGLTAQVDYTWAVALADGKTATTAPYQPNAAEADANPSTVLRMASFTGVVVRARYLTAGSLSTDPVVRVWGLKGSSWTALRDADGASAITLADDATTDCNDGTYKYTLPSEQIDALGCEAVLVTIQTAAVSAAGAVRIEITRY